METVASFRKCLSQNGAIWLRSIISLRDLSDIQRSSMEVFTTCLYPKALMIISMYYNDIVCLYSNVYQSSQSLGIMLSMNLCRIFLHDHHSRMTCEVCWCCLSTLVSKEVRWPLEVEEAKMTDKALWIGFWLQAQGPYKAFYRYFMDFVSFLATIRVDHFPLLAQCKRSRAS